MENPAKTHHVAILTSPGIGHTIPVIELGKRIISLQGFQVTIFITTSHSSTAQSDLLQSPTLTEGLHRIIQLPRTDISGLVPTDSSGVETSISLTVRKSLPVLKSTIMAMEHRPTVLIVDIFGTDAFDLADELGMLKYVFITTTAKFTALTMYLPTLDKEIKGEYVDQKEPIQVPGCKPIQIENLIDPMQERKNDQYSSMLHQASRYPMAHGILINTCEELEPIPVRALKENPILQQIPTPSVYPVGPLTRYAESSVSEDKCLDWLNKQPSKSVLFVSFGSGGTLSAEQITELAWGLELSQQRFLWVVRAPTIKERSGTYFTSGSGGGDPSDYLPEGFLSRTLGVGLVVPSWCPQLEILKHQSIGGCLSHCGWNTTLESIVNGVPLITWPLFAEQRLNASMLTEDIGVAIRPATWPTKELVGRTEIEKMVRLMMEEVEGNPWRVRAKELKNSVLGALDEGGSSHKSLLEVAKQWKASYSPFPPVV
ncbi:UDP-glucuronosyl/UDP-glucosyltransferase [Macleaya cordata]|uniref:UDP-glucuronosyl/UDP-glucosyltransferase n=1 Tax=Macleaya cordata TaxID=56857 RepID=A0A200R7F8_MACCD|nr:UDP-glucuronosyl/UDP-glucosyltransferase [Macleaya cordata]